jgi:uncharacterized protein
MKQSPPSHAFLLQGKQGNYELVEYLVGLVFVVLGSIFGSVLVSGLLWLREGKELDPTQLAPAGVLVVLVVPFIFGLLALWFVLRRINNRSWHSLLTAAPRLRGGRLLFGLSLWMGLALLGDLCLYGFHPEYYHFQFEARQFFPILVAALLLLPFQTSMEELLMRGYLLQAVGAHSRRPWVALLLSAWLFGLLHGANPEVGAFGEWILLYYVGFGAFLALITLMDEGLELALGIHAGNNLYGVIAVSFPNSALEMPSLFLMDPYPAPLMTGIGAFMAALFLLLATWRYRWQDWGKLFRKIGKGGE